MWIYHAGRHTLRIIELPNGMFGFQFDNDPTIWEACPSPEIEASNIAAHVTGCDVWDSLDLIVDCPESLAEWSYRPG